MRKLNINLLVIGVLAFLSVWIVKWLKDFKVADLGETFDMTSSEYKTAASKSIAAVAKDNAVSELAKTSRIINIANRIADLTYGWKKLSDWFGKSQMADVFNMVSALGNEELRAVYVAYGVRITGQEFENFGMGKKTFTDTLLTYFEGHETYYNGIKQRFRVAGLI
ncbi:hypothetical protein [Parapedobacter sp. 2B3]|uniref:hypothetical protein n=1 Tax=Parapedobacter sp. 2B3 TaxID=3342381 RepID=UPI0035B591E1